MCMWLPAAMYNEYFMATVVCDYGYEDHDKSGAYR